MSSYSIIAKIDLHPTSFSQSNPPLRRHSDQPSSSQQILVRQINLQLPLPVRSPMIHLVDLERDRVSVGGKVQGNPDHRAFPDAINDRKSVCFGVRLNYIVMLFIV